MRAKTFTTVAELDALRDGFATKCDVAGRAVVVVRKGDVVKAYDGTCTHAKFQFCTSRLVQGRDLECPMHGALFDWETGQVRKGPAKLPLKQIETAVDGNCVMVCMDDERT